MKPIVLKSVLVVRVSSIMVVGETEVSEAFRRRYLSALGEVEDQVLAAFDHLKGTRKWDTSVVISSLLDGQVEEY